MFSDYSYVHELYTKKVNLNKYINVHTLRSQFTGYKWVSYISCQAGAHWNVIPNIALGIDSTGSRTRVNTFVPLTCFV